MKSTSVTATITIGKIDVEIEGTVVRDNARDPVHGRSERIVDGDIVVIHPDGRRLPLVDRYESRAVAALVEAAEREDA